MQVASVSFQAQPSSWQPLPLLLPLATKAGWCLGHFSSHLSRRRWEGKKKKKTFELKRIKYCCVPQKAGIQQEQLYAIPAQFVSCHYPPHHLLCPEMSFYSRSLYSPEIILQPTSFSLPSSQLPLQCPSPKEFPQDLPTSSVPVLRTVLRLLHTQCATEGS